MNKETRIILGLGIILHLISYAIPFLERGTGFEFFARGVEAFYEDGITRRTWYLFYAFFAPILGMPLLLGAYYKGLDPRRWHYWNVLIGVFIIIPVAVCIVLVANEINDSGTRIWGFVVWTLSYGLLLLGYWQQGKTRKELDQDDMSEHLIDNEG